MASVTDFIKTFGLSCLKQKQRFLASLHTLKHCPETRRSFSPNPLRQAIPLMALAGTSEM
jgi:hypothetical protein